MITVFFFGQSKMNHSRLSHLLHYKTQSALLCVSSHNSFSFSICHSPPVMESSYTKLLPILFGLLISVKSLLPISATSLNPCDFPAIFNFGDSNSDTGGLSAVFGQAPPPYGETYFHSPAGRYCDGRLIIDFIGSPPSISSSRRLYMSVSFYYSCYSSILSSVRFIRKCSFKFEFQG